jgi:hypothetical protein
MQDGEKRMSRWPTHSIKGLKKKYPYKVAVVQCRIVFADGLSCAIEGCIAEKETANKVWDLLTMPPKWLVEVQRHIRKGTVVDAIRVYREYSGLDLKESRDRVLALRERMGYAPLFDENGFFKSEKV